MYIWYLVSRQFQTHLDTPLPWFSTRGSAGLPGAGVRPQEFLVSCASSYSGQCRQAEAIQQCNLNSNLSHHTYFAGSAWVAAVAVLTATNPSAVWAGAVFAKMDVSVQVSTDWGKDTHTYKMGEDVVVWTDKVGPYNNPQDCKEGKSSWQTKQNGSVNLFQDGEMDKPNSSSILCSTAVWFHCPELVLSPLGVSGDIWIQYSWPLWVGGFLPQAQVAEFLGNLAHPFTWFKITKVKTLPWSRESSHLGKKLNLIVFFFEQRLNFHQCSLRLSIGETLEGHAFFSSPRSFW